MEMEGESKYGTSMGRTCSRNMACPYTGLDIMTLEDS